MLGAVTHVRGGFLLLQFYGGWQTGALPPPIGMEGEAPILGNLTKTN